MSTATIHFADTETTKVHDLRIGDNIRRDGIRDLDWGAPGVIAGIVAVGQGHGYTMPSRVTVHFADGTITEMGAQDTVERLTISRPEHLGFTA